MATTVTKVKLTNGAELLAEVEEPSILGVTPVGIDGDGKVELGAAMNQIQSAASEFHGFFASLAAPPDSAELSFGIKLSASAGVIIAKAGTEANFGIKLSWSPKKR